MSSSSSAPSAPYGHSPWLSLYPMHLTPPASLPVAKQSFACPESGTTTTPSKSVSSRWTKSGKPSRISRRTCRSKLYSLVITPADNQLLLPWLLCQRPQWRHFQLRDSRRPGSRLRHFPHHPSPDSLWDVHLFHDVSTIQMGMTPTDISASPPSTSATSHTRTTSARISWLESLA